MWNIVEGIQTAFSAFKTTLLTVDFNSLFTEMFGSSLRSSKIHNEIDKQVCKQSF